MTAITTAVSGLQASATRLAGSASNIANVNTRGPIPEAPQTEPATRRRETAAAAEAQQVYQSVETVQTAREDGGVKALLKPSVPSFIPEYDPDAAYANKDGLVAAPDVDIVSEMVNQMEALRSFRANMATVRTAGEMEESLRSLQA